MATKTISIDVEAYCRLKNAKRENESFSQTIKRVVPQPVSTAELIKLFRHAGTKLSDGFFAGVESALEARNSAADMERIDGLLGHDRPARSNGPRRAQKTSRRRS